MNYDLNKFRTLKMLPALLLAVFISAQIGLVGHLHADDRPVTDCLQCQFDNGHAAIHSNNRPAAMVPASIHVPQQVPAAPIAAVFMRKARGPPALS
ncbi:hypothetical protein NOR53_1300 [gamma proteobacterium NOR5-3]|nr:hypothetical protein NOR53_1300 [gamma proteobacterium NOR5-3]